MRVRNIRIYNDFKQSFHRVVAETATYIFLRGSQGGGAFKPLPAMFLLANYVRLADKISPRSYHITVG